MRRISTVGACVLALVALGAVAVSSASAAGPEYITCAKAAKSGKTYTGEYNNKTCSEENSKSEGKYERAPLTVKKADKVKGTVGAVNIYLYEPKNEVEPLKGHFVCTSGKFSGSIINSHEGTIAITYSGCEAKGTLAGPCNSPHAKNEIVATSTLASKLVWLNEAETEPGIQFKAKSGAISTVECDMGIETAELVGTMTAKIAPTKETSKAQTMTFTASSTTGAPEFSGQWEGATFLSEPLQSNLKGVESHEAVPTSQNSVLSQKGPDVLIGNLGLSGKY